MWGAPGLQRRNATSPYPGHRPSPPATPGGCVACTHGVRRGSSKSIPHRVSHGGIVMAMSAASTAHQPIRLPDWAWQRTETRQLLAERDIAALFRLAQRYGSVSQARIAAAVGISQSRVNEIIHGRRGVVNLDVLLRIAEGLNMP